MPEIYHENLYAVFSQPNHLGDDAVGASYVNANAVGEARDTQTVGVNAKFRF